MIGQPLRRREDARVLRGQTRYVDDIERPGLVHAAFVRSPHASAAITGLSVPECDGDVLAVLTGESLRGRVAPIPVAGPPGVTLADAAHPILALDEVRYVGQPVAAVIAPTRALAEDGAERVEVSYEPRVAVVDPRASTVVLTEFSCGAGDVDGAFARADHVVRGRYGLPRLAAVPIETRGVLAEHDAGRDVLTLWCSAQDTHRPLAQLSHILGRPEESIHVIIPDVGGAFGSKGVMGPEVAASAVAAIDLGRPVKWTEDRLENFLAAYQGRGIDGELALALDADGTMLALRAQLIADLGAYLLTSTAIPPHTAAMLMTGCYAIPAAAVSVAGMATNKVPTGPYRGAGRPEAAYLLECLVDDAARAIGLDRVELRRRNLIRTFPAATPLGFTYDSGDYERCLDTALSLLHEPEDPALAARGRAGDGPGAGRVRGTGVAMYVERAGGQWEAADVTVAPTGRVLVRSSASPHGQGHDITFAAIVADRLDVAIDDVVMRFGDSAEVPRGVGTFGSRSVAVAGSAVALACDDVRALARALAAHLLEVSPDAVAFADGRFAAGERALSWPEVAAAAHQPARLAPGMDVGLRAVRRFASDVVFSSGAYGAVVEIERATGHLDVLRIAAVDDAGTIINPLLAHGQVLGGTVQGLGECLSEAVIHDEAGQLRSASLMDYSLLTAAEIPPIAIGEVSSPSPLNPLGAKGVGEGGAIGTLAAVANAVADALGGRHVDPPYLEATLWAMLGQEGT
jgi:aerobic carbon-monoxide dehydrogenase large subunit